MDSTKKMLMLKKAAMRQWPIDKVLLMEEGDVLEWHNAKRQQAQHAVNRARNIVKKQYAIWRTGDRYYVGCILNEEPKDE